MRNDPINQQKGVPMGQNLPNAVDVYIVGHALSLLLCSSENRPTSTHCLNVPRIGLLGQLRQALKHLLGDINRIAYVDRLLDHKVKILISSQINDDLADQGL